MKYIILFLKGISIGMTDIIPGVSGATTAMLLGIYDKIIENASEAVQSLKQKEWHKLLRHLAFLAPIFIGLGVGMIIFAKVIKFLLTYWPNETPIAFAGIILGSLPTFIKKSQVLPVSPNKIISFIAGASLMIIILLWDHYSGQSQSLLDPTAPPLSSAYSLKLFFVGLVASVVIALPGISGSLVLLLMGEYTHILAILNQWSEALLRGQMYWQAFFTLVSFSFGILIGLFFYSFLVSKIMKHYKNELFSFALGLILFSIIKIWPKETFSPSHLIILALAMAVPILSARVNQK